MICLVVRTPEERRMTMPTNGLFTRTDIPVPTLGRRLTLKESSDLVTQRIQSPLIEIAIGKQWYCTSDTLPLVNDALGTKHTHDWLQKRATSKQIGVILCTVQGWRYVRWETSQGNAYSHVY